MCGGFQIGFQNNIWIESSVFKYIHTHKYLTACRKKISCLVDRHLPTPAMLLFIFDVYITGPWKFVKLFLEECLIQRGKTKLLYRSNTSKSFRFC